MSADTEPGRPSVGLSLILASIGAASLELAICGATHSTGMALARAWGLIAVMLVAFAFLTRRRDGSSMRLPRRESLAIGLLATLPFLWHPATSALRGDGVMLETMLLECLRNLGLGLAAFSRRTITTRLAVIVSLFGVMVGSSLVEGTIMTVLAGAFAAMGVVWLLATYWASLPARFAAAGSKPPLAGAAAALVVVAVILLFAILGPTAAATKLAGLVPSSGGVDWPDPDARSGVGDGPNEVEARDSADSVGFTQSEVYLETDKPSLYDAFNETFGEPFKKNKQEKAIALGPNEVQQNREHPAEDNRAGREFSTHRKPPGPRSPASEAADALLYVQGRAPAHLRLVAYDFFDGTSWLEGETGWGNPELHLETSLGPWLRIGQNALPGYLSGRITHRIKFGLLETRSVPTPAHLERFRVGSVNRPDFFEWAQPSVLAMSGRIIPPGTVIDTQVRSPRLAALREVSISEKPGYAIFRHYHPGECSPAITRLAETWTRDTPRGWRQVEALTKALRDHCAYDPSVTPPQNCPDLMAHFLLESHRGPDYLFATAAALMLRSLTYPARVVGGFYVDPDQYDPIARHVPIHTQNAHLWVEVQLPGGEWVTIEPTPGFDLMTPALSLADNLVESLAACLQWARRNLVTLAFSTLACGLLLHRRRQVLDRACTLLWWLLAPRSAPPHVVLSTLRLLERRASWAGRGRPSGQTPTQWCGLVVGSAPQQLQSDLQLLVRLAQWSAFAPLPLPESIDALSLCRRVVESWTLNTFHTLAPGSNPSRNPSS